MSELGDSSEQYLRSYGDLTPEKIQQLWDESVEFLKNFYLNSFNLSEYMPVVKDGYEDDLNKIQFYIQMMVLQGPEPFARAVMFGTQAAFWIGYLEGKKQEKIELPKGFYDALGE